MTTLKKVSLGCDPELFLKDAFGTLRSSIGLIGGSKETPLPLPLGDGFAVQEDNVAVEFNIAPAQSVEDFDKFIGNTLAFLGESIQERYGLAFSTAASAVFGDDELMNPAARMFGCDPDYNAWTMKRNPRPEAGDPNLRSCGGHVHVGYQFESRKQKVRAIRLMDLFLGVPSTLLDQDNRRKELYGKRGAFRDKPYGVEYRTLSNFWVFNSATRLWVGNNTLAAMAALQENKINIDELAQPIEDAIDNNNKAAAEYLVNSFNISMPA